MQAGRRHQNTEHRIIPFYFLSTLYPSVLKSSNVTSKKKGILLEFLFECIRLQVIYMCKHSHYHNDQALKENKHFA